MDCPIARVIRGEIERTCNGEHELWNVISFRQGNKYKTHYGFLVGSDEKANFSFCSFKAKGRLISISVTYAYVCLCSTHHMAHYTPKAKSARILSLLHVYKSGPILYLVKT